MLKKTVSSFLLFVFCLTSVAAPDGRVFGQTVAVLPAPGMLVTPSPAYMPVMARGLKVHPENPLLFDFIVDVGDPGFVVEGSQFKAESEKLIKYFLASLTVPEKDLWVNLSPYEKDRIVPEAFGRTEMGRDLLAQDYILKQITASLIYPDEKTGKEFWDKVYAQALKRYGTTDVPVDTFNKVWIVPEKATVYENNDAAYVVESGLKVMLESDYVAMSHQKDMAESSAPAEDVTMSHQKDMAESSAPAMQNEEMVRRGGSQTRPLETATQELAKPVLREIIIPILEKEVNEGKNFTALRQVYSSLILATWYKRKFKAGIFGQAYVDQQKTAGVDIADKNEKEKIWAQYVEAFQKGTYNLIREEVDPTTQAIVPRKYFSGGCDLAMDVFKTASSAVLPVLADRAAIVEVKVDYAQEDQEGSDTPPSLTRIDDIKRLFTGLNDLDDRLGVPHYNSRWHREGGYDATLKDHLQRILNVKNDILSHNFPGSDQDQELISLVRAYASRDNDELDAMILLHDHGKKEAAFRNKHGDMGFKGHEEKAYRSLINNKVMYKGKALSHRIKMAVKYHDMHWKINYAHPGEFEKTIHMMRKDFNGSLDDFEEACEFITAFSVIDVLGSLWEGDRRGDLGSVRTFHEHFLAWKKARKKFDRAEDHSVVFGGGKLNLDHPLVISGRIIGIEDYDNVGGSNLADYARKKDVKRIYFDLDLTVFRSMGYVSSSQWFEHASKEFGLEQTLWWWGNRGHEARQIDNDFFFRLMDPGIPAMIEGLKAQGIECVGLTARDNDKDEPRTQEILARFGVEMNDVIFASGAAAKAQAVDDYEKGHGRLRALFVEDSFFNLEKFLPVHAHVDAIFYRPVNANQEDEWDHKVYLEKARADTSNGHKFEYYFNAVVKILELKGITREIAYEQLHQIHHELLRLPDPKPAGYDKLIQVLEISKKGQSYLFHDPEARELREKRSKDRAMLRDPGGIDLTPGKIALKTRDIGEAIKFNSDPAMLQRLQKASGVTPVIIGIHSLDSLRKFMNVGP